MPTSYSSKVDQLWYCQMFIGKGFFISLTISGDEKFASWQSFNENCWQKYVPSVKSHPVMVVKTKSNRAEIKRHKCFARVYKYRAGATEWLTDLQTCDFIANKQKPFSFSDYMECWLYTGSVCMQLISCVFLCWMLSLGTLHWLYENLRDWRKPSFIVRNSVLLIKKFSSNFFFSVILLSKIRPNWSKMNQYDLTLIKVTLSKD